ncbi:hypothetical protein HELRODRAFT_121944, partial [Helobdella robusta]|uniref:Protein xylosyltransferase n=1 Tax=Helobdella robusta TaxID=6412 RepID=T1EGT2_HELRO
IEDQKYLELTKNCTEFKTSRNFILKPLSEESRNFPIAFNFIVHKSAYQIELLLRSLYRPQNVFCIHVDSKSSEVFKKAIQSIAGCFDNVYMASKFESINWAGFSRLQADITCMEDHLSRNSTWKYLINTAGQAFPIKTVEEMVRILTIYNGSNDIEGLYGKRLLKNRFENEWIEDVAAHTVRKTNKLNPKPPHNIDIVRGSAYGIFSKKFVEFIIKDERAKALLKWSEKTWSPDEFYWSTLHHTYSNPHLHTPGGFSGKRFVCFLLTIYSWVKYEWLAVYANWGENSCSGKFVRSICVFGVDDVINLIDRREFFVNKFYHDYQPLALSCISAWIHSKEM